MNRAIIRPLIIIGLILLGLTSCAENMEDQQKYEIFEQSEFFPDGSSSRPVVPGTVARGEVRADTHLYEGKIQGRLATSYPIPLSRQLLERGKERYEIYCSLCHGLTGHGDGIIVQRGFLPPPSLHEERLRTVPVGYLFDVITNGFGAMYSYADRVPPLDRWRIIAYIQALQLSQNASWDELGPEMQEEMKRELERESRKEQQGEEGVTKGVTR